MDKLSNNHLNVMRMLVAGHSLTDLCRAYNLPYSTWHSIVESPLFQAEMKLLQEKKTQMMLERELEDPVLKLLRKNELRAAQVFVDEMNNFDYEKGATPTTRMRGAEGLLNRIGYTEKVQEKTAPTVVQIEISPAKGAAIAEKLEKLSA